MAKKVKRRKEDASAAEQKASDGDEEADGGRGAEDAASKVAELTQALAAELDFAPATATGGAESSGAEASEMAAALRQLAERLKPLAATAKQALERACAQDADGAAEGSGGYVEAKVQILLSYLVSLAYYLLLKTRGVPVREHPVVMRLIWIRTLLEKLRPIDQRLQYQFGKLLQMLEAPAAGDAGSAADLKSLKPGQLAASAQDDGDDEEEEQAPEEDADDGVYKPPKIAQVEYTGDHVSMQERAERDLERAKTRLERSEFVRSLREEFTELPTEVHGVYQSARAEKAARKFAEQQEYEEERMVRLRTSKRDLKAQRRMLRETRAESGGAVSLDDATADFREISRAGASQNGGRGRKGLRRGSALQEFQNATDRANQARHIGGSALGGGRAGGRRKGGGRGGKKKR